MTDHWVKQLKPLDTVLWVVARRIDYDSGRPHMGMATVVRVANRVTKAGYITANGMNFGPIFATGNELQVPRVRAGRGVLGANSSVAWIEQDTPDARARYEIDADGVNLRKKRRDEAALPRLQEDARRDAIFDQAQTIYETLRSIMADAYAGRSVSKGDVIRWEAIEAEIAARVGAVK